MRDARWDRLDVALLFSKAEIAAEILLRSIVIVEADELDVRLQIKTVCKDLPRKTD